MVKAPIAAVEDASVTTFMTLLDDVANKLMELARFVADELDKDQRFVERVVEAYPKVSETFVMRLYAVGKGALVRELMFNESHGGRGLMRMPLAIQEKYVAEPIEIAVSEDDTVLVDVDSMSKPQVKLVFDTGGRRLRSLNEQRRLLVADRLKVKFAPPKYRITKSGDLVVNGVILTKQEVLKIAAEIQQ